MRPVKATFNNKDTTIANREVIFMYKRGDDLRQVREGRERRNERGGMRGEGGMRGFFN